MPTVIDYYADAMLQLAGSGRSLIGIPFDVLVAVNVHRREDAEKQDVRDETLIDQLEHDARLIQAAMEFAAIAEEPRPKAKEG